MNENPPVEVVMALYELDPERVARFKGDTMPTNEQSTRAYWLDLNFYEWRARGMPTRAIVNVVFEERA